MVQVINDEYNQNVFGRLGKGIGRGLSEQIPKEIERSRLASGLKKLEQEKDLDPMKFFTRAATLPGATPQLIESLGQLAKQRMKAQALSQFGEGGGRPDKFPEIMGNESQAAIVEFRNCKIFPLACTVKMLVDPTIKSMIKNVPLQKTEATALTLPRPGAVATASNA